MLKRSSRANRFNSGSPKPSTDMNQTCWEGSAQPSGLQETLDSIPVGVIVFDGAGSDLYRNEFAQRFTTGRHTDALVEAAVEELAADALGDVYGERRLELYGPPPLDLALRSLPVAEQDQDAKGVIILEDESEKLRANRVRTDFVANVSHELKTPVGAIGVLAETLASEHDPTTIHRLADRLQIEALRLGETIEDLLALSRVEANIEEDSKIVRLSEVVSAALERSAPIAENRGVDIVALAGPSDEVSLDGDSSQLVSAVTNLIGNAIKYSDSGSTVEVNVAMSDQRMAAVSVGDEGVGIPEADLDRIFERFYRVDSARSRASGGTGLGLSIVRHVALNHGGSVEVESAEGVGSTFTLFLPCYKSGL